MRLDNPMRFLLVWIALATLLLITRAALAQVSAEPEPSEYTIGEVALTKTEYLAFLQMQQQRAALALQATELQERVNKWLSENAGSIIENSGLSEADKQTLLARTITMREDLRTLTRLYASQVQQIEVSPARVREESLEARVAELEEQRDAAADHVTALADEPGALAPAQERLDAVEAELSAAADSLASFRSRHNRPEPSDGPQ